MSLVVRRARRAVDVGLRRQRGRRELALDLVKPLRRSGWAGPCDAGPQQSVRNEPARAASASTNRPLQELDRPIQLAL